MVALIWASLFILEISLSHKPGQSGTELWQPSASRTQQKDESLARNYTRCRVPLHIPAAGDQPGGPACTQHRRNGAHPAAPAPGGCPSVTGPLAHPRQARPPGSPALPPHPPGPPSGSPAAARARGKAKAKAKAPAPAPAHPSAAPRVPSSRRPPPPRTQHPPPVSGTAGKRSLGRHRRLGDYNSQRAAGAGPGLPLPACSTGAALPVVPRGGSRASPEG